MDKQIVIVSGFSGVGKGTLLKRVLQQLPDAELVRSCTTRTKRNDDDYYTFLSDEEFGTLISEKKLLEYNCYSGKFYGTPVNEVKRILSEGKLPIAEIDPNGFIQVIESETRFVKGSFCKSYILFNNEQNTAIPFQYHRVRL